jgi:aspartyl protease family protein
MPHPGPWGRSPRKVSRLGLVLWLAALAALGGALWALQRYFPDGVSQSDGPYVLRLVAILAVVSSGLLFVRNIDIKRTTRNILLWVGVAGIVIIGFSYQDELGQLALRLRSELVPGYPVQTAPHEMVISESPGGSFLVYGAIDGTPVQFLVDTGASDIVLSPMDAKRIGIDPASLSFDHAYETANGMGRGAKFTVARLSVGDIQLTDVPVSIDQAEMSSSLLGMSFLKRLKSFGFSGRKLILRG